MRVRALQSFTDSGGRFWPYQSVAPSKLLRMQTHFDGFAWAVGIIEGEGSFVVAWLKNRDGTRCPAFQIKVKMADRDVLVRLQEVLGVGHVTGPRKPTAPTGRPLWVWACSRRAQVKVLIERMLPHLSARRAEQARSRLKEMEQYPGVVATTERALLEMPSYLLAAR